ncbi:hypothetical protein FEM48_Zijuj05G0134600 [Ziziphus jujuba var. spinosa]|uniref:At1g61320/AtMIF1 LRR domain-containing protein n=1 Tax=Ziziphus jujuba var. spinosa TaxID=714518 RepID=A0A978VF37_ZIZJJ|nr:hypothetical protein FEM48_Zijuj05G0134600 [Ziziphus jujuba var. spinosa]
MMKKKRKFNVVHQNENNVGDRISELDNGVLVNILSLLPLKKAVASSILSRRWLYVWTNIFNLNIEAHLITTKRKTKKKNIELESKNLKFVEWLTDVVKKQHKAPKIDQFRVCFRCLGPEFDCFVRDLIEFAMIKRAHKLELDFALGNGDDPILGSKYSFPEKLCQKHIGFESLQVLEVKSVNVSGGVIERLLSNCPVLERLSVYNSPALHGLRVFGRASLPLKCLVIRQCHLVGRIEIDSATNLVSLYIERAFETNLVLRNVPKLFEVSMIDWCNYCTKINVIDQVSCCLSQLEILRVGRIVEVSKIGEVIPNPILTNLKHLHLPVDIRCKYVFLDLNSIVEAVPYLQRLVFMLSYVVSYLDY